MTTTPPATALTKTPLNARHRAHGARMVEFGGWDMPVEYSGIIDEHMAVRTKVGLFDVSHMGQIELAGADALAAVQWISSNDASRLAIGQIQYSALTTPEGTFVDDILVYRMADQHFMLVVNAGNIMKDHQWIVARTVERGGDVSVVNASPRYALIAIQGPEAERVLQTLTTVELADIKAGQLVLDVATGIGEPAVTAARKVGPTGKVVATDQAPLMLAIARERAAELGLTGTS